MGHGRIVLRYIQIYRIKQKFFLSYVWQSREKLWGKLGIGNLTLRVGKVVWDRDIGEEGGITDSKEGDPSESVIDSERKVKLAFKSIKVHRGGGIY